MSTRSSLSLCALMLVACGDGSDVPSHPGPDAGGDEMAAAVLDAGTRTLDAGKKDAGGDAAQGDEERPDGWVPRPADAGPDADHGQGCNTLPEPTRCALLEIVRSAPPMLTLEKLALHANPREGSYVLSRMTVYTGAGDAGAVPPDAGSADAGVSFVDARGLGRCEAVAVHDGDWQAVAYWDKVATERFTNRPDWPHGQFSLRRTCGMVNAYEFAGLPMLGSINDEAFVDDGSFVLRGRRAKGPPSYLSFDPLDPVLELVYQRISD